MKLAQLKKNYASKIKSTFTEINHKYAYQQELADLEEEDIRPLRQKELRKLLLAIDEEQLNKLKTMENQNDEESNNLENKNKNQETD